MDDKRKAPKLRFSGFTDDWEQRKLGELTEKVVRKAPKDSDAPVMMISSTAGFINQSEKYSNDNAGKSLAQYTLLRQGEMAYNHGYSKLRNFGSCFDLKCEEARIPFVYHSFTMPNDDTNFYAHYLNCGMFDYELKKRVSSTARMDGLLNISYDTYMTLEVFHPSVEEQKKIGDYLSSIDNLITLHQRKLEQMKVYKRAMLTKMFPQNGKRVPEIRFPGFTDDWEQCKLEDISLRIIVGLATTVTPYYRENGIPMFRNLNIKAGYLDDRDMIYLDEKYASAQKGKTIHAGDIATVHTGNIGWSCVIPEKYEGALSFTTLITTVDKVKAYNEFVSCYLNSDDGMKQMQDLAFSGGRANLNTAEFQKVLVPLPSIKEQMAIAKFFINLDNLITLHQRKLEQMKEYKKGLLQQMFV